MREVLSEKYEKRNRLLKLCMEKGMSNSMISELVEPMKGKTDEEKEVIAAQILKEKFNISSEQIR